MNNSADSASPVALPDGIRLSIRIPPDPSAKDLAFVRQLGVDHVNTWLGDHQTSYECLVDLKGRLNDQGLILFNAGNLRLGKSDRIHLALPGRDQVIADFKVFIQNLSRAGIHTTTFTWEPDCVQSTANEPTRGGAMSRAVDLEALKEQPPTHQGAFSHDDIWENYTYFIREIIPVAESEGVRLALHPNDPPLPDISGIPCLIHNRACYERAFEIADSPNLGMEFCVGCWSEGGEAFGDIAAGIRDFVAAGKVFIVHFRNISAPLPHFVETFIDDGCQDMAAVLEEFHRAGFRGTLSLDHFPMMTAGEAPSVAFAIGYVKAMLDGLLRPTPQADAVS